MHVIVGETSVWIPPVPKFLRPALRRAADFMITEQHDDRPDYGHDKADRIAFTVRPR